MVSGSQSRGSGHLIRAVGVLLIVAACVSSPALKATDTTAVGEAEPSTTSSPGTTSESHATSPPQPVGDPGLAALVPDGEGPFPTAVLVHGGGWIGGSPELMGDLAVFLAGEGYLTVNAPYSLANGMPGFPVAVDDVACAVRYAAAHPDGDGTVAVIGHSAGAHLAALVSLDTDVYGQGCPLTEQVIPDRLIGLAGPYDVARLGPLMLPFFGVGPDDDPELWAAGNPLLLGANNPGLSSLLMHGEEDALIDLRFASDFADALTEAGSEVLVEVVEDARHNDMHDPAVVGDLIITWLQRRP